MKVMYRKSRQLLRLTANGKSFFIDTPGYLYHYEPFGIDVFLHHRIMPNDGGHGFWLHRAWTASDTSTGLALLSHSTACSRDTAVLELHVRLSKISLKQYNEAVWNKLTDSPPHKASWRFNKIKGIAVEVGYVHREQNSNDSSAKAGGICRAVGP